jgi:hypothetical protein
VPSTRSVPINFSWKTLSNDVYFITINTRFAPNLVCTLHSIATRSHHSLLWCHTNIHNAQNTYYLIDLVWLYSFIHSAWFKISNFNQTSLRKEWPQQTTPSTRSICSSQHLCQCRNTAQSIDLNKFYRIHYFLLSISSLFTISSMLRSRKTWEILSISNASSPK